MRRGTFGRSFNTLEKAVAAAVKLARQTGQTLPVFQMKKDVCDESEAYIVMFPGTAKHILDIGPGLDNRPPTPEDEDDAPAPTPAREAQQVG